MGGKVPRAIIYSFPPGSYEPVIFKFPNHVCMHGGGIMMFFFTSSVINDHYAGIYKKKLPKFINVFFLNPNIFV